jgi:hypothetical protein
MRYRIAFLSMLVLGLVALAHPKTVAAEEAQVADCGQGAMEEQVACLNQKVAALEAKTAELVKETLKWNDRISLLNEDMRIFPRCLENPGPNTPQLTDVYATSCTKTPAQAWMIRKPYQ